MSIARHAAQRYLTPALLLTCLGTGAAWGQALPQGSQLLRDAEQQPLRPPPQATPELSLPSTTPAPSSSASSAVPTVQVQRFELRGNQALASEELLAVLAPLAGQALSLQQLHAAAAAITAHYRRQGYPVAFAYVPPQDAAHGVVVIEVMEGRLDEVKLGRHEHLGGAALAPVALLEPGQVVRTEDMERVLLLLTDLPGVVAHGELVPGRTPGSTTLNLETGVRQRVSGALELDNHGNRYVGAWRLGGRLNVSSPLGLGDRLALRALHSDEQQRLVQLSYQVPLNRWGTQVGVAHTSMDYELARQFSDLQAHGRAHLNSVFLWQPLVVKSALRLNVRLQYDHKRYQDDIDLVGLESKKSSEVVSLSLEGQSRDNWGGGGSNVFSLKWSSGDLALKNAIYQQLDAVTARAAGSFHTLQATLARWQRLDERWSTYVQLQGQWANGNLDSSEKLALGGPYAVRGYPPGEASGDQGWVGSAELRYAVAPRWQLQAFVDHGSVRSNKRPWTTGDNHRSLSGAGLGATWVGQRWQLQGTLAWRLGNEPPQSDADRRPRLWVQSAWRF